MTERIREGRAQGCIDGLPHDLILKIILRLPLKSLARLKLLSKKWYFLIASNEVANFLVQNSDSLIPQTLIFQSKNSISSLKFDGSAVDVTKLGLSTTPLDHPLPESHKGVYYYCAGSYNGIVCVHITISESHEQILLWNPITRECRPIPLPPVCVDDPPGKKLASYFQKKYWFGYVDLLDDVIIFHLMENRSFVYSMRSDEWKETRNSGRFAVEPESKVCRSLGTRFFLKDGVLYYALGLNSILKFDLVNETFGRMPFLQDSKNHGVVVFNKEQYNLIDAAIGFTPENKLCSGLIFENPNNDEWILEIWIWVKRMNPGWWKRKHRICLGKETPGPYPWVIGFTHEGKIFVGGKQLVIVDPKLSGFNVRKVETKDTPIYTVNYVETLLSPYLLP